MTERHINDVVDRYHRALQSDGPAPTMAAVDDIHALVFEIYRLRDRLRTHGEGCLNDTGCQTGECWTLTRHD
jgi:hypothetical protein